MHRLAWRSRFSKDRFQSLFRLPRRRTRKQLAGNGINGTVIRPIGGTRRLSRTIRESEHGRVWVSGHEFNERIGTCCKSRHTINSTFHLRGRTSTVEEPERCAGRLLSYRKASGHLQRTTVLRYPCKYFTAPSHSLNPTLYSPSGLPNPPFDQDLVCSA
jgi:hypothetical protein